MEIEIRAANAFDLDATGRLYNEVVGFLNATENLTGWGNEYPTRTDAEAALSEGALYVALREKELAGTVILNQKPAAEYFGEPWQVVCEWSEVLIIHTLAVDPRFRRNGIAEALLKFAEALAKQRGLRAIRLDGYRKNEPAFALYEKLGYKFIGMVDLNLHHLNLDWFRMYELEIK